MSQVPRLTGTVPASSSKSEEPGDWKKPELYLLSTTRGTLAGSEFGGNCTAEAGPANKTASANEGCDFGDAGLLQGGS